MIRNTFEHCVVDEVVASKVEVAQRVTAIRDYRGYVPLSCIGRFGLHAFQREVAQALAMSPNRVEVVASHFAFVQAQAAEIRSDPCEHLFQVTIFDDTSA